MDIHDPKITYHKIILYWSDEDNAFLAEVPELPGCMATVHGMDFLLTWNCKHIANATMRHRIEQACRTHGFEPPIMTTPEQLLEE